MQSLALFGSAARGDARPDSDIDLLVKFSRPVGLFDFLEVKAHLAGELGRRVDVVTPGALKPHLMETVLAEAVYATQR